MQRGERRSAGRTARSLIGLLLVVLIGAGVIGFVAIPSFRQLVTDAVTSTLDQVRRFVAPELAIERPVSVTTDDELADHPVSLLFDGFTNTDWRAAGVAPTVVIEFEEPVDLGAIIVHSGAANGFVDLRRPAALTIVLPDGTTTSIELEDVHDPQRFDLSGSAVDGLEIRVSETNGPAGAALALSEIELFARR